MERINLKYPPVSPVFFVGASAGGVEALSYLAKNLPEDFTAPLFLLLHRKRESPKNVNLLPKIIKNIAKMEVVVPQDGDLVLSSTIYMPQEDKHIIVEDNRIRFIDTPDDEQWRPSIDVLFKSGAREYKDRSVCALLTGNLDDGVEGLIETTMQGGVTIAQSPEDAFAPILPLNALLRDHPDYVLPLRDMPKVFCELAKYKFAEDQVFVTEQAAIAAKKERKTAEYTAGQKNNSNP